ncbi:hypothetical protein D3C85_1328630 [compost metagenome]
MADAFRLIIQPAPIQFGQQRRRITQHHLQRFLVALPEECGAQNPVTPCGVGPGFTETRAINPAHAHFDLVDVQPRVAVLHRVEQHALLHRRQRIDVLDFVRRQAQRLILRVTQFDFCCRCEHSRYSLILPDRLSDRGQFGDGRMAEHILG